LILHVVEDDMAVSDALKLLFSSMGCVVATYPDAESFLQNGPPKPDDTILVDLMLPGLKGSHVVKWLQELKSPPRIIVMTGQPVRALDRQLEGMHVEHILRKPLSEGALLAIMNEASLRRSTDRTSA
jgi:FixJ family two-component response regulator